VRRFERPDRRSRWDSPLFELVPSRGNQIVIVFLIILFSRYSCSESELIFSVHVKSNIV
jgi:tRNA uridine 5-carbamoylmethylation protein Kti12